MEGNEYLITARGRLTIQPLTVDMLDQTVKLCADCVGENLYSKDILLNILDSSNHWFYLLMTDEGEIAAYTYFYLMTLEQATAFCKLSQQQMSVFPSQSNFMIAHLQAIGIQNNWRGQRLSEKIVAFFFEKMQSRQEVASALGVCWKPDGIAPMEKTLQNMGFNYLGEAHRVWYDYENLICPYCNGRCKCDAVVYYKSIREVDMP